MAELIVSELAYVRMQAPDLELGQEFLDAFGLQPVARTEDALYMRGTDAGPYCHVLTLGEPRFVGAAFILESEEDLQAATNIPEASGIEPNDEPGGGQRVRLKDPNGFDIELLYGIECLPELEVAQYPINTALGRQRHDGALYRRPEGPARIKRLGHFVIGTPNIKATQKWYRETLGLLGTDDVWKDDQDHIVATFNRLGRGKDYVDHHVFMAHEDVAPSFNHLGFEVQDYDDIFFGHYHMKKLELEHRWGLGRHRLGSQVFNQWTDPWGRGYEHWTDSDMLNEDYELSLVPASEALKSQWGEPQPANVMRPLDK